MKPRFPFSRQHWVEVKAETARLLGNWRETYAARLFQLDRFERWHIERIAKAAAWRVAQTNVMRAHDEPINLTEAAWTSAHDRAESQPEITMRRYARPLAPLAEAMPSPPDGGSIAPEPPEPVL